MPRISLHESLSRLYMTHIILHDLILAPEDQDFAYLVDKLSVDIQALKEIRNTCYLRPRVSCAFREIDAAVDCSLMGGPWSKDGVMSD